MHLLPPIILNARARWTRLPPPANSAGGAAGAVAQQVGLYMYIYVCVCVCARVCVWPQVTAAAGDDYPIYRVYIYAC
jgi:hypothetical protein